MGQTLTVTWYGNVTLDAAALSITNTESITATRDPTERAREHGFRDAAAGDGERTAPAMPVNSVTVTFTAPASSTSGAFAGSATATATTNASGVATAPTFTASSSRRLYGDGKRGRRVDACFNSAVTMGGSLSGSGTVSNGLVNLTSEGSSDWEHWGDSSLNRKGAVAAQISNYTLVGAGGV